MVDDEGAVRTMLGRVLSLAGFEVAAYASGEDFIRACAGPGPACVVLDLQMPGLSGLDTHDRVAALHPGLPIVFITGSDDPSLDDVVARIRGAVLLRKPFGSDVLLAAVSSRLEGRGVAPGDH